MPVPSEPAEAQQAAEVAARVRRGWLVTAGAAAVVVVLVAVTALLGGFRMRSDLRTPVAPGSMITTGPYELSLDSATVQHKTSEDEWDVVASGLARTTGTTSIDPDSTVGDFLAARSVSTREVQTSDHTSLGDPDATERLSNLTPGLPPVPWTVTFVFHVDPGDQLFVAVTGQEYTTPYIFGTEKGWQPTSDASTMTLPLKRLADQEF